MREDQPMPRSLPEGASEIAAPCEHDRCRELRLKLRELVWRVDQARAQLESKDRAIDDLTLAQFLDTSDLHPLMEAPR